MVATGRRRAGLHQQQISLPAGSHYPRNGPTARRRHSRPSMPRRKNRRDEYSVTLDWPYRSMGPTTARSRSHRARPSERKSLAAIITLQKFFIDLFAVFVNNLPVKDVHLREKRWNRVMAVK